MKIEYNFDKIVPCIKIFAETKNDLEEVKTFFTRFNVELVGLRGSLDHKKFVDTKKTCETVSNIEKTETNFVFPTVQLEDNVVRECVVPVKKNKKTKTKTKEEVTLI